MFQYVPHLFSSDPSAQSFSPSHRKVSGTQRVLLSQRWWQPSISLEQSSSSERSWQSYWPSHTLADGMHRLPWEHWNSSGTEKKIWTMENRNCLFLVMVAHSTQTNLLCTEQHTRLHQIHPDSPSHHHRHGCTGHSPVRLYRAWNLCDTSGVLV